MSIFRHALVGVAVAMICAPAFAKDFTNEQLQQRIQKLKTELAALQEIVKLKNEIEVAKKRLFNLEKRTTTAVPKKSLSPVTSARVAPSPIANVKRLAPVPSPVTKPIAIKIPKVVLGEPRFVASKTPKRTSASENVAPAQVKKQGLDGGRWEVSARRLYLRQIEDTKLFVPFNAATTDGTLNDLEASFGDGFEGRLAYYLPNSNWGFSVTGRHFSNFKGVTRGKLQDDGRLNYGVRGNINVNGSQLFNVNVNPGAFPTIKRETTLGVLDVAVENSFKPSDYLTFIAGVRFAYIDRDLDTFIEKNTPGGGNEARISMRNRSFYKGVGPRIGVSVEKSIYGGLSARGQISGSVLAGVSEVTTKRIRFGSRVVDKFRESELKMVPALDGDLGLQYRERFGPLNVDVGAGVTTQHWLGLHDFMSDMTERKSDEVAGSNLDETIVGFFGPYFRARVTW